MRYVCCSVPSSVGHWRAVENGGGCGKRVVPSCVGDWHVVENKDGFKVHLHPFRTIDEPWRAEMSLGRICYPLRKISVP